MERWMLVDGNNWANIDYFGDRADVAAMRQNFLRRLHDMREKVGAARVCVAFDGSNSWRKEGYSYYKADRDPKPRLFLHALLEIENAVAKSGCYEFHKEETFEADDLIADLSRDALEEGCQSVIFSRDADLHQCLVAGLVTQCLRVKRVYGNNIELSWMTAEKLFQLYRVHPWQWVEFRMLAGDKSDCLKAIPDFGPSGASKVLSACKTLDGFLQNPLAANITGKERQAVIDFCKSEKRLEFFRLMTLGKTSEHVLRA